MLRRRLLDVLSLLSLILCGITVVLCVCSRGTFTAVFWVGEHHYDELCFGRTGCTLGRGFAFYRNSGDPCFTLLQDPTGHDYWDSVSPIGIPQQVRWAGWAVCYESIPAAYAPRTTLDQFKVHVPWWSLFLATATLPASIVVERLIGRERHPNGLCPSCGYDLRATPGRCSECGWREVGGVAT